MKVNSINNITFQKAKVATCQVKDEYKMRKNASLYLMNPMNSDDIEKVENSDGADAIRRNFLSGKNNNSKFYTLEDDESGEIIACAQTSQRYSQDGNEGYYTILEELQGNPDYVGSLIPMISYVAHSAQLNNHTHISTAFRQEEMPKLRGYEFMPQNGVWTIPETKLNRVADNAEYKCSMEYII